MIMKKLLFILLIVHCSLLFVNAQWVTQNSGTTEHLFGVSFINTQTGWACGNGGIITTTNGGITWSSLLNNEWFMHIQFINSLTGYVIGNSFKKTTNGGLNWFYANGSSFFRAFYFLNTETGWAVGEPEFGPAPIGRTTNGGLNWVSQQSNSAYGLYSVFFVNEISGWTVGAYGTIKATTNGGLNWTYQQADGNFSSVHFQSPTHGWAVGNKIFSTTNGGLNWIQYGFSGTWLYSVDFANQNTGFAVGGFGVIFATTNAGVNWSTQQSGTNITLATVSVADSVTAWISGLKGLILKTTNGGLTSITSLNSELPESFKLNQNYPNPFNPSTEIHFALQQNTFVSIKVYNIAGEEVVVLINNEYKNAGYYKVFLRWFTFSIRDLFLFN
jgi:photosystem II stability/assembly factor-like uncharacterized protein